MVNSEQPPTGTLSQAALGRLLGLSPAAITKLKGQGMPVDSVEAAKAWREARLNVAARKPSPPIQVEPSIVSVPVAFPPVATGDFGDEDFQMARTRREIAEANMAEMKEAESGGVLIRIDAVRAAWAKSLAATRDALLQIPSRVAPLLAVESDVDRVGQILDAELRQAMTELTRSDVASGKAA
jgi:phage terminase Nu1 subunit (DNA packaging protein)